MKFDGSVPETSAQEQSTSSVTNNSSFGLRYTAFKRLWLSAAIAIVTTIAAGFLDPFGLQSATDRYSKEVLNKLLAPFYSDRARTQVTVVVNTDRTLEALGTHWPMPLDKHAGMIQTILRHQPSALFVDYIFQDNRKPANTAELREVLTRSSIPVYYAAAPGAGEENRARSLPAKWRADASDTQLRPVSITRQHGADTYDLARQRMPSPALALFRAHCDQDPDCRQAPATHFERPMDVIWGSVPAAYPGDDPDTRTNGFIACDDDIPSDFIPRLAWMFLNGANSLNRNCPYIRTIPAEVLTQKPWSAEVRELLRGNLVLYGGSFHGAADLVESPTHGSIPGVQLHAMALHNLLLWGDDYVSPVRAQQSAIITPAVIEAVSVLLSYSLFVGFLIFWTFFFPHTLARFGQQVGEDGIYLRVLIKRGGARLGAVIVGLIMILALLGGVLAAQWVWFRLSPINWLGIFGLCVAFLGLFTPYFDRLPALDVDGAETEKQGEGNAR